jgi:hypothetical protein
MDHLPQILGLEIDVETHGGLDVSVPHELLEYLGHESVEAKLGHRAAEYLYEASAGVGVFVVLGILVGILSYGNGSRVGGNPWGWCILQVG